MLMNLMGLHVLCVARFTVSSYRCLFFRVFEFTILNEDIEESMKQLKEAASYCFK
jgi:hypothetical protein